MTEGDFSVCVCKDCGKQFVMTYNTYNNFKKLGLESPSRCKACVVVRRTVKNM
ncbi:MAG: zinc-ribbon domain containing protein [Alphaproteobacteria bacterium]|nr:zinc-ribbon domain containing protein [Alphaproteobacteria bacterium]